MPETYPPTLQGVSFATLAVSENQAYRTNDSDIGPATYQLLSEDVPTIFSVGWVFFAFDFQVFENWFKFDLTKGVKSFNIKLPVGAGILTHECNFRGKYTATYNGKLVNVSATLRAIEKQTNTQAQFDDLLLLAAFIGDKDKVRTINNFNDFVNIKLPDQFETINYGTDFS